MYIGTRALSSSVAVVWRLCRCRHNRHGTGHESRLGRKGITDAILFGSHEYSGEELVAEMGAAFLCGHCGIDAATLSESTSYIAGWLRALQNDTRMVVVAAVQAQKAADLILNVGEPRLATSTSSAGGARETWVTAGR